MKTIFLIKTRNSGDNQINYCADERNQESVLLTQHLTGGMFTVYRLEEFITLANAHGWVVEV